MADHTTTPEPPGRRSTSSPSNNGSVSHRASFAENLRHSPRSQRHPSFTQAAVQELLQHPPASKPGDPRFAGRDWRSIHVGELVKPSDVRWVELESSIQEATNVCTIPLLLQITEANAVLCRHLLLGDHRMLFSCARTLPTRRFKIPSISVT